MANNTDLGNVLYAKDAEAALLGTLLNGIELDRVRVLEMYDEIFSRVDENDFSDWQYKEIFKIMAELWKAGGEINLLTVGAQVAERGLDNVALVDLAEQGVGYWHYKAVLEVVEERGQRRRIYRIGEKIEGMLSIGKEAKDIINSVGESLWELESRQAGRRVEVIEPGKIYLKRKAGLEERIRTGRVLTNWSALNDLLTYGFVPGMLSVIAGRPSMGKSALKTNISDFLAEKGYGVVHFAPEQGFDYERDRSDAIRLDMGLGAFSKISDWREDDPRLDEILESNKYVDSHWNVFYIPTMGLTMEDAYRVIRSIQRKARIDIVFFDLFSDFLDVGRSGNLHEATVQGLQHVKKIKRELGVHVCLLVQLSRAVENRRDKHPQLSDLRESGGYEESADLVLLLYREKYYNQEASDALEILIAKQRHGPRGVKAILQFDEETTRIYEGGGDNKEDGLEGFYNDR